VKTETTIHTTVYGINLSLDVVIDHETGDYRIAAMRANDIYGLVLDAVTDSIDSAVSNIIRAGPRDAMDIVKAAKERHLDRGEI